MTSFDPEEIRVYLRTKILYAVRDLTLLCREYAETLTPEQRAEMHAPLAELFRLFEGETHPMATVVPDAAEIERRKTEPLRRLVMVHKPGESR